jgi:hypothetical protein
MQVATEETWMHHAGLVEFVESRNGERATTECSHSPLTHDTLCRERNAHKTAVSIVGEVLYL